MKHAGAVALAALEELLDQLRRVEGLREKKAGVFYYRSKAFLHFHEDPAGLFADVRLDGDDFTRLPVDSATQRNLLLRQVKTALVRGG